MLYPTTKEFANFSEYMSRVEEEYSHEYGMVKVCNVMLFNMGDDDLCACLLNTLRSYRRKDGRRETLTTRRVYGA